MLSFKKVNEKSFPIAKVNNGKNDGNVIYFNEAGTGDNELDYNIKLNTMINEIMNSNKHFSDMKNSKRKEAKLRMREHLMKEIPPLDDDMRAKYNNIKDDIIKKGNTELFIRDGELQPIATKKRQVMYVTAPSGAGKSYFINQYAESYHDLFPKNKMYLFCGITQTDDDKKKDELHKNKNIIDMEINEDILEDPITPAELNNSLTIFDDTMAIRNPKINKELNESLLKDLMETGRHDDIHLAISNHLINEYKKTKAIMNESTHMVFFLNGGNIYAITYCLKNYLGFDRHQIKKLLALRTRWVMIIKQTCPMTVLYQYGCYILGSEKEI